jgi:uncharacterized protein YdhG (YjbR/CyaY superfamily)
MAANETLPADGAAATTWIDTYLEALPADQRAVLQGIRETIAAAAPTAVEAVSYRLPAFRYRGKALVWYHAAKAHCSLFPTGEGVEAFQAELAGFEIAKGTIRFTPDHPLPKDLVERIVRHRLAQIDAGSAKR